MLSRASLTSIAVAFLLLAGCRQPEESPVIARVYDHELHKSDLVGLVGDGVSAEDSAAIVDNYVEQWVRQMVILSKAEKNVTEDFSQQLGEYRNSLLIYAYEQQILNQLLDTAVTEQQMVEYYETHQDEFHLRNSIVKVVYVVAPRKTAVNGKLRAMVSKRNFDDDDVVNLEEFASRYGFSGYYDANTWMPFYALQAVVPITVYNEELYLKQNRSITLSDDSLSYYVKILDYKVSDDIAPLELQYDNVRAIILNHRRIEILSNLQRDLMKEAEGGGKITRNKKKD